MATCMKPIVGGDYFAATLPQWLSFQKVMGVSKVGRSSGWQNGKGCPPEVSHGPFKVSHKWFPPEVSHAGLLPVRGVAHAYS